LPKLEGIIQLNNKENEIIQLVNTCSSFDYFLFGLWLSSKLSDKLKSVLLNTDLNKILDLIERRNWNEAKHVWLIEICKQTPEMSVENKLVINCNDDSRNLFAKQLCSFQNYLKKYTCSNVNCVSSNADGVSEEHSDLKFYADEDNLAAFSFNQVFEVCSHCDRSNLVTKNFVEQPPFLIIENDDQRKIKIKQLPKKIKVLTNEYKLLCCNFSFKTLYKAVFYFNDKYYIVENEFQSITQSNVNLPDSYFIVSFYYLG